MATSRSRVLRVNAPAELLLGEQGEPALHQIDPGRALRREVQMVAWALREPPLDRGRLVSGVVVHDQMDVEVHGDRGVDRVQEPSKLDGPMPAMPFANHAAALSVERRKERGGPVADVVVGPPDALPG